MLEFDGQALDPAIVSAQPMKLVQTVDLQQLSGPLSKGFVLDLVMTVRMCPINLFYFFSPFRVETFSNKYRVWTTGVLTGKWRIRACLS